MEDSSRRLQLEDVQKLRIISAYKNVRQTAVF